MDQTPIFFTFRSKKSLSKKWEKSIAIYKSVSDSKQAMLAVSITAAGNCLTPYLSFKGTHTGRIVHNDFPSFSSDGL